MGDRPVKYTPLLILLALLLPSCAEPWNTPYLVAGAATWVLPFDKEFRDGSGYTLQAGCGEFDGLGLRYMDVEYTQRPTGFHYDAHTYLAYIGFGLAEPASSVTAPTSTPHSPAEPVSLHVIDRTPYGFGQYCGFALGATEINGPGVSHEWDFSGGLVYGVTAYCDIGPRNSPCAVLGLAAEIGCFFANPGSKGVGGGTGMLGMYIDF
jgi:hypothetical protein